MKSAKHSSNLAASTFGNLAMEEKELSVQDLENIVGGGGTTEPTCVPTENVCQDTTH